tara:strand:- start:2119 stop:6393 length:4275 start_codon:yes stop_codon:yes gene_type:complete
MSDYNEQLLQDQFLEFQNLNPDVINQKMNKKYDVKKIYGNLRNNEERPLSDKVAKEVIANDLLFLQGFTPEQIKTKIHGTYSPEDIIEESTSIRKRDADDKFFNFIDKGRLARALVEGAAFWQGAKRGGRAGLAIGAPLPPTAFVIKGLLAAGGFLGGGLTALTGTKIAEGVILPEDPFMPGSDQAAANAADTFAAVITATPTIKALATKLPAKEIMDASVSNGVTALRNAINPAREAFIRKTGKNVPFFKRINQSAGKSNLFEKIYGGGSKAKNVVTKGLETMGKAARVGPKDVAIPKAVPLVGGRTIPAKLTGPGGLKLSDPFVRAEIAVGASAAPGAYIAEKNWPGETLPRILSETATSIVNIPRVALNVSSYAAEKTSNLFKKVLPGQVDKRTGEYITKLLIENAKEGETTDLGKIIAEVQDGFNKGTIGSPGQVTLNPALIQVERELVRRVKTKDPDFAKKFDDSTKNQLNAISAVIQQLRHNALQVENINGKEASNLTQAASDLMQNRLRQTLKLELVDAVTETDLAVEKIKGPEGIKIDNQIDEFGYSPDLDAKMNKIFRNKLDDVLKVSKEQENKLWNEIEKTTPVVTDNITRRYKEITDPNNQSSEDFYDLPGDIGDLPPQLLPLKNLMIRIREADEPGSKSFIKEIRRFDNRIESVISQINKQLNESDIYRKFEKSTDPNELNSSDKAKYNQALKDDPELTVEDFFMMEGQPIGFLMDPIKLAKNPVLSKPRLKNFIEEIERLREGDFEGTRIGKGKYADLSSAELGRLKKIAQDTLELTQLNQDRAVAVTKYPKNVLNIGTLLKIRQSFRENAESLVKRGDRTNANILSTIGEAILEDLDDSLVPTITLSKTKSADQLNALMDARVFSKTRNDVFGNTFMTETFQRNPSGRPKLAPELFVENIFDGKATSSRLKYNQIKNAFNFLKKDPFDSNPLKVMKDGRSINVDESIKNLDQAIEYIFRGIAGKYIKEENLRNKAGLKEVIEDFDGDLKLNTINPQQVKNFITEYRDFFNQPSFEELKDILEKGGEASRKFLQETVPDIVRRNKDKESFSEIFKQVGGKERPEDAINFVIRSDAPLKNFNQLSDIVSNAGKELPEGSDIFVSFVVEDLLDRVLTQARLPGDSNAGNMLEFALNTDIKNIKDLGANFKKDFVSSKNSILNVLKNKNLLKPETENLIKEQLNNLKKVSNYYKELSSNYLNIDPSKMEEKTARIISLQAIGSVLNRFNFFQSIGNIQAGAMASDIGKEVLSDAPMFLIEKRLKDIFDPKKGNEFAKVMEPFKDKTIDLNPTTTEAKKVLQDFENGLLKYFGLPIGTIPLITSIKEEIVAPVTDKIVPTGVSQEKKEIEKRKETRELNIPIPKRKPSEEKVSQLNISSRPSITAPPAQNVAQANLGPFNPETLARMEQLDRLIG